MPVALAGQLLQDNAITSTDRAARQKPWSATCRVGEDVPVTASTGRRCRSGDWSSVRVSVPVTFPV